MIPGENESDTAALNVILNGIIGGYLYMQICSILALFKNRMIWAFSWDSH